MYEIKVEAAETVCRQCGNRLGAVAVRPSGAAPAAVLDAVLDWHRGEYPAQWPADGGLLLSEECPACPYAPQTSAATDRAALVALYHAAGGPGWARSDKWLTDAPLREWRGVTADAGGRVIELDLRENGLKGAMPPELGNLAALTRLYLSDNELTGEIPPELGHLSGLQWLVLNVNGLTGEIPRELGHLAALQWLVLSANRLNGELPRELGRLASLEWMDLSVNQLTGAIPPELGNLSNLQWLDLSWNQLTGHAPPELHHLDGLAELNLAGNQLIGQTHHNVQ